MLGPQCYKVVYIIPLVVPKIPVRRGRVLVNKHHPSCGQWHRLPAVAKEVFWKQGTPTQRFAIDRGMKDSELFHLSILLVVFYHGC